MELQSIDSEEGSGVGTESMDENSVFSAQFCCEVKSALKNKVYLKKIKSESVKVKLLSCVRLFATPWTVAYQASPSMGFSRQEYWSGVPLPSPYTLFRWSHLTP